jgi:hypothetical protein
MTEISDGNQTAGTKPWQFQPGQSGNPDGRPKGARNAATLAAEALLDGEAEALTRKCVEMALAGDTVALRLCLERILPARKSRSVAFDLPDVNQAADLVPAFAAVVRATASGTIAPDEAMTVAGVLEMKRKAIETVDIERRLAAIEARQEGKK